MGKRDTPRWRTLLRAGILLGFALLIAGFMVRDIRARAFVQTDYIAWALWILGGVLAAGGIALDYKRLLALLRGGRTAEGVNFAFVIVLVIALAGLLCYITTRRYARLDWTGTGKYELHTQTERILASLQQDVRAVVLYRSTNPYDMAVFGFVGDMLDEMKSRAPRMQVQELDLSQASTQPRVNELLADLGVQDLTAPSVVFIVGDRHEAIPFDKIAESSGGSQRMPEVFKGEAAFAGALKKLTEGEKAVLYALTGHGERPLEAQQQQPTQPQAQGVMSGPAYSLSRAVNTLERDNYEVKPLNLAMEGEVPEDCAALLVAGPKTPLGEGELRAIRQYLDERNGSAVIMLESDFSADVDTNVDELLMNYGIGAREDAVGVAVVQGLFGSPMTVAAVPVMGDGLPDHPATSDLRNYTLWFEQPVPLEIANAQPTQSLETKALLRGVDSSWGETDLEPGERQSVEYDPGVDVAQPVIVGALVQPASPRPGMPGPPQAEGPKLLVLGSSLSFANATVEQHRGNLYLLSNAANWMAGKMHMLGIPPKSMDVETVSVSSSEVTAARYLFIGGLPALCIAAGIVVWVLRRR
ncbi:MAG: GldG family protein [Candidatus Brocadiia bacterium]